MTRRTAKLGAKARPAVNQAVAIVQAAGLDDYEAIAGLVCEITPRRAGAGLLFLAAALHDRLDPAGAGVTMIRIDAGLTSRITTRMIGEACLANALLADAGLLPLFPDRLICMAIPPLACSVWKAAGKLGDPAAVLREYLS